MTLFDKGVTKYQKIQKLWRKKKDAKFNFTLEKIMDCRKITSSTSPIDLVRNAGKFLAFMSVFCTHSKIENNFLHTQQWKKKQFDKKTVKNFFFLSFLVKKVTKLCSEKNKNNFIKKNVFSKIFGLKSD